MKKSRNALLLMLPFTLSLALTAVPHNPQNSDSDGHAMHAAHSATVHAAVAMIEPTEGNDAHGIVTFTQIKNGIRVQGEIQGLTPGKHGFHVHEYGDLSKADGTSAGGHFNPKDTSHGAPSDHDRHIGDLGNIEAGADGVASFDFIDQHLSFSGASSILGRGLIVHAGEDDLKSQPTGSAGARVGMAIIGVSEHKPIQKH